MELREYLKTKCPVDLDYIAKKMWPANSNAKVYLSMKINGKRPWTSKDEDNARSVLHALGIELSKL